VSDLNDELRRLADEAARQARPLPVADVIRQGDRRYRWALWPRALTLRGNARSPGLAAQAKPGRRWPGLVAPLAAAGAVIAVVAGTAAVSSALHGPRAATRAGLAHGTTAYVVNSALGTVIPIQTATNTALPPIKTGGWPLAIAITPDGKTAYVSLVTAGVTPIRTTTNTALPGLKIGYSGPIAITP
jgi:hypothetical protein